MDLPNIHIQSIRRAYENLRPFVHQTPVFSSQTLNQALKCELYFKAESLQKVGAFKARGATHAVFSLNDSVARRGVIAHSSGNHGAALAYAARRRGIPATVVIPNGAPEVKVEAIRGYGATIEFCAQPERETVTATLAEKHGFTLIHPYASTDVITGQATAALEFIEQQSGLDAMITPVGGGGLLAGTTLTTAAMRPQMKIYGAEPLAVDDAARSLASRQLQPAVKDPQTLCDGLLTGLGEPNFAILMHHGVQILTIDESAILAAAKIIYQRLKLVVEPSAATVLAAILEHRELFEGQRVGLILSGGNTDFSWLPDALAQPNPLTKFD